MTGDNGQEGPGGEDEMQADSAVTKETECEDQESTSSDTKQRKNEPLAKCSKCKKRHARRACILSACLSCCSDLQCEGHREARENAQWKEAVLTGTTDIQIKAKAKRASAIIPGSFREPGFLYLNQTITLWDRNKFMKNKKWKEEAIRRSEKRKARSDSSSNPVVGNSRKRFRTVMEDLYRKSLDDGALDMFEEKAESARVS